MERTCNGECIYGKCPHPYCIRYKQKRVRAVSLRDSAAVLRSFEVPEIESDKSGFGFAVDIGTTTVVVYLYDLAASKLLSVKSALNPQISAGTDVISRISYCERVQDGLSDLHNMIVKALDELFNKACEDARVDYGDVRYAVVSGNTVMLHLFANISPVSMGTYPFMPESLFGNTVMGSELGFSNDEMQVYMPPCISAFVGADITSAILASRMVEEGGNALLMDLGTNGELALKAGDKLFTTSAPAGPAFEGAGISCGMASVNGAICSVSAMNSRAEVSVIGDSEAAGICGSGLIDAMAFFLKAGIIDETGLINIPDGLKDSMRGYAESDGENFRIRLADNVFITQKDVREIQNAKAAVAAGVDCLLKAAGVSSDEIESVYIAGGFGNALNAESAADIGLINKAFKNRVRTIGNGSAAGAAMMLLNDGYRAEAQNIASRAESVQIGGDEYFAKQFIENLNF